MNSKAKTQTPKLPFVFINMAMTADGKIATVNRVVSSFGSQRDHDHLLALRATADAVLAGARTVDSAEVNLGPGPAKYRRARIQRGLAEYNLRIIVSRFGSVNPQAEIFKHRFSPIIILTTARAPIARLRELQSLADEVKICGAKEIDFRKAFAWLGKAWGIKRLLCEGGGELNSTLFRAGVVDELNLTVCPKVFGGREAPTIAEGLASLKLSAATRLKLKSSKQIAHELFLSFSVLSNRK